MVRGARYAFFALAWAFFIGVLVGTRLFARFNDVRFRQFTLVLLLAVSIGILLA